MKFSRREMLIGIITLFCVLFGLTYWLAGTKIAEQRSIAEDKSRLRRQIQLHKRILEEQERWTGRLQELQAELPVYEQESSVRGEIRTKITTIADEHGLDLNKIRTGAEKRVGTLYETTVTCDWRGELEELIRFLYKISEQGLQFDIREISVRPNAKEVGILTGDMIIECAYRRSSAQKTEN